MISEKCPQCGSDNTRFVRVRQFWHCDECSHRWKDTKVRLIGPIRPYLESLGIVFRTEFS